MLDPIQRTIDARWPTIPRLVAGLPLLLFGLMHLVGATPIQPILEAAGMPAPGALAVIAPSVQAAAGLLLVLGWMTRIAAAMGGVVMLGAIASHVLIPDDRWPQPASGLPGPEPVGLLLLAILILGCTIASAIRGGGLWSMDRRQVASRASMRGGGLDGPAAPRPRKGKKPPPTTESSSPDSVW